MSRKSSTPKTSKNVQSAPKSHQDTASCTTSLQMTMVIDRFRALSLSDQDFDSAGSHLRPRDDDSLDGGQPRDGGYRATSAGHGIQHQGFAEARDGTLVMPTRSRRGPEMLDRYLSTPERSEIIRIGFPSN